MAEFSIHGPDGPTLGMEDVRKLLGMVHEDTVKAMIAQGRFPRPIRAGSKSPPQWAAAAIACWLHLSPMMYPDDEAKIAEDGRK